MKPVVIIAISVVCSVVAVLAVLSLSSGENFGESIANIVPYDCAKGWEKKRDHTSFRNSDEMKELSIDEQMPIRKDEAINIYQFNKNLCNTNHEEWQDRANDPDGHLAKTDKGTGYLGWAEAISDEIEYNQKFPNGHWQDP